MTDSKPMPVTITNWRAHKSHTLRGFAELTIGALRLKEVTVHEKEGRRWASLPMKPMVSADRVVKEASGRPKYVSIIEWSTRESADRFSAGVCEEIARQYPDAFDA